MDGDVVILSGRQLGFLLRNMVCAFLSLVIWGLLPTEVAAEPGPTQTFFVNLPSLAERSEPVEICRDRFTSALVRAGGFRANQDAVTQQSVSDCLRETVSASASRACEVSMVNINVDFLILPVVRRIGRNWNWSIKAISPAQGAAQVWGGDHLSPETDVAQSAYESCDALARQFACEHGSAASCETISNFGGGPLLTSEPAQADGEPVPGGAPTRVTVSALDVLNPTPVVVSIWIDGKEAGTSESQVTGVTPGRREVVLKATGFLDVSQTVNFVAGKASEIAGAELPIATATLEVSAETSGSFVVLIDGREVGRSGSIIRGIAPGERQVKLRSAGYRDYVRQVSFRAGVEASVTNVNLEPLPAQLIVNVNVMSAELLVDGVAVGESSGERETYQVSPEAKVLDIRKAGYINQRIELALGPGASKLVEVSLKRASVPRSEVSRSSSAGLSSKLCPVGYVHLSPGEFFMGSPEDEQGRYDDEIRHSVVLTRAFCVKATEVTQDEWAKLMGSSPSFFSACGERCPVEQVSWIEAVAYANTLSAAEGLQECYEDGHLTTLGCAGYRLPTEAEWEYAARAGTIGPAYGRLDRVAWFVGNSEGLPHEVGQKQPNPWGIFDMLGNVWEWTGDKFGDYPRTARDPVGAKTTNTVVIRGGSWNTRDRGTRFSNREEYSPAARSSIIGFRLVRTMP